MYVPNRITPEFRRELEESDPTLLSQMERENSRYLDAIYPEPTPHEMWSRHTLQETGWNKFHASVREQRDARYLQEELPNKLESKFHYAKRVYTRLIHNEIMRVVAMLTRNLPQVDIPQASSSSKDLERAQKQQRFCQELLAFVERTQKKPVWRPAVDAQAGDGLAAWFIYMTDAYDRVEKALERKPGESDRDYNSRTDDVLRRAGAPFGIRVVGPIELHYDEDELGVYVATIKERKPRRAVYQRLIKTHGQDAFDEMQIPSIGTPGQPQSPHAAGEQEAQQDEVDTMMYYDRRWYAYFVDGVCVEGPMEHKLPGVPIIPIEGMTTSSPNYSERFQGITWGLKETQSALDALLSVEMDVALSYGRPFPVVETPSDGNLLKHDDEPAVLKLNDDGVPQLMPGQTVTDLLKDFAPKDTSHIQQMLLSIWERSGLNPIAQGQAPGADPAGYTVNTLQGAAQSNYEVLLDNLARSWALVCDFVRLLIRDTIQEKVSIAVPMQDEKRGGTEWLDLGPDDIDETPSNVYIDPLSDANRMQKVQMLAQMNKEGFVPRRMVQEAIPGIEDTQAADNEVIFENVTKQLVELATQIAMQRVRMMGQEEQGPQGPPDGQGPGMPQMPPDQEGQAPPGAPTVGAGQAAASQGVQVPGEGRQGPPIMNSRRMSAGQSQGYHPPEGQMTDGQGRSA